jgi:hypothetical protein
VQQILSEWMAVDWFTPPALAAEVEAMRLFVTHHMRARAHEPELFPEGLEVRTAEGGWAEFADRCARVRGHDGWDWKFTALKPLSSRHSKARGWSLKEQAPELGALEVGKGSGPGDLFFRFGDSAIWNNLGPKLDLAHALAPAHAEVARFYLSYACMDLMECVEWQLAERSSELTGNPFLPLVRCYAAGFLPFCLGPSTAVLFGFKRDA